MLPPAPVFIYDRLAAEGLPYHDICGLLDAFTDPKRYISAQNPKRSVQNDSYKDMTIDELKRRFSRQQKPSQSPLNMLDMSPPDDNNNSCTVVHKWR